MSNGPPLHPDLAPLGFLVGTWRGEGRGEYPTIEPFEYGEEISIAATPKAFLAYAQRTWAPDDRRPLHVETGYWRLPAPGMVELLVVHPTGVVEVDEGDLVRTTITLRSTLVGTTWSAKKVTGLERRLTVEGDALHYTLAMAAVGLPMIHHLEATLRRVPGP